MALLSAHIHLICRELGTHPVRGTALTLGSLKVIPNASTVTGILRRYDRCTPATHAGSEISCASVLRLLGAQDVSALDVSDYQGADLVWNLNDRVPSSWTERFDYILDGGTLEHVFDLPTALDNISRMVTVGGSVALMTPASNSVDHGFYSASPTLYVDYFEANGFDNVSCYLAEICSYDYSRPVKVYRYPSVGAEYRMSSKHTLYTIFFATKRTSTPAEPTKPIQSLYRTMFAGTESDPAASPCLGRRCRRAFLRWAPRSLAARLVETHRRRGITLVGRW